MIGDFIDRVLDFFDLHMIERTAYFRENNPNLYFAASGMKIYELSATHEAMIRSTLRKTRLDLSQALKIDEPIPCAQKILNLCCFNEVKLADELGSTTDWIRNVKKGKATAFSSRIKFLRQEAQWIMEDIKELLND